MRFLHSQMLYNDGSYYTWQSPENFDNSYYRKGDDGTELQRTKGFEVLYFINHLAEILFRKFPDTTTLQEIERIIKEDVPGNIFTHKKVQDWIVVHWKEIK